MNATNGAPPEPMPTPTQGPGPPGPELGNAGRVRAHRSSSISALELSDGANIVQRLVEYFVVVSSVPRWTNAGVGFGHGAVTGKKKGPGTAGMMATADIEDNGREEETIVVIDKANKQSAVKGNGCGEDDDSSNDSSDEGDRRGGDGDNSTPVGSFYALASSMSINNSYSEDSDGTGDDVLAPPKPRGRWARERKMSSLFGRPNEDGMDENDIRSSGNANSDEGSSENIHLPTTDRFDRSFQPRITARFPFNDYPDDPLNPLVTQFCYPAGDVIVPVRVYRMPHVHHFVLTNDKGRKIYGTCLTIYEEYYPSEGSSYYRRHDLVHDDSGDIEVTVETKECTLYLPRCLCILSTWPYMTAFREYLAQLYRLALNTNVMDAPIERYILNLCMEIPAPPPGVFEVRVSILDSIIRFWAPPAKLPIAYVSVPFRTLFDCLDVENILHLWFCLSMERKVLLVSHQCSILTICAEALCSLLFPMRWSHLYVPVLPRFLCGMLDAPVPYICGVHRDCWLHAQQFVSNETIVVDLDTNRVMFGQATPELPPLPRKIWKKLNKSVRRIAGHLFWKVRGLEKEFAQYSTKEMDQRTFTDLCEQKGDSRWKETLASFDDAFNLQFTPDSENLINDELEQSKWDTKLQECFLRFFVAVLKDYRKFLLIPISAPGQTFGNNFSEGPNDVISEQDISRWAQQRSFDGRGFIASQKPEYFSYLSELCATQQFDDFITTRLYTPDSPDIIFFDQSIDAKLNRSRLKVNKVDTPFLQNAKAHKVLKSIESVRVNTDDVPDYFKMGFRQVRYKSWPEAFITRLFGNPRPLPSMITAEFDRQAALESRLRGFHRSSGTDADRIFSLSANDFDRSVEAMSFVVFFFVYSAVIGKEWQEYQLKRRNIQAGLCDDDVEEASNQYLNQYSNGHDHGNSDCIERSEPEFAPTSSTAEKSLPASATLRMCTGTCPDVSSSIYFVTRQSPIGCPKNFNKSSPQIQVANDAFSLLAKAHANDNISKGTSLLDDDVVFAEYEEARDVASAQLDLAFDALDLMTRLGLEIGLDLCKSLMKACGRCGNIVRTLELIEIMKREGLVVDREVLSCYMAAFAYQDGDGSAESRNGSSALYGDSDAYLAYLKRQVGAIGADVFHNLPTDDGNSADGLSESASSDSSTSQGTTMPTGSYLETFFPGLFFTQANGGQRLEKKKKRIRRRRRRRRRRRQNAYSGSALISERLNKQNILGENLIEYLYPDLHIDTENTCPKCSNPLQESDIVSGWRPCKFQDYTTACSACGARFIPKFTVFCSSKQFVGSQGPGSPLYCELLSPWTLRKELHHILLRENGIDEILDPSWRSGTDIRATLWWNLIIVCYRHKLPFTFLLQGSFLNRLINPLPEG